MKSRKIKSTLVIFESFFKILFLRSKEAVFWLTLFPTILFLILTTIFGNTQENVELKIKIVGKSQTLEKVLKSVPQLNVEFLDSSMNFKAILEREEAEAIVIIPQNFDEKYSSALLLRKTRFFEPVLVDVYYAPVRQSSKIAKDVLVSVLTSLGTLSVSIVEEHVLSQNSYNYNDFVYPGVLGMALLSVFLFGFMNDLEYFNKRRMLRRMKVAPVNLVVVYLMMALVNILVLFIGIVSLSFFAYLKGVDIVSYAKVSLFHILLACFVMTMFVLSLMTFFKKSSSLFAFQQIFFQVQMFVGGFYIPLKFTHPVVQNIAKFLPITYTVDAIRKAKFLNSIGHGHLLVPVLYLLATSIIVLIRSKKLYAD
ncbi:MAG: ABC transporter permease [Fervidobacterium sp.]